MTIYTARKVFIDRHFTDNGWVRVEDGRIVEAGVNPAPEAIDLGNVQLVPGYVDIHCHGGGSASFSDGPEGADKAAEFHRDHGTTSVLASLATATLPELSAQCAELVGAVNSGVIAGIHLEGPFISPARKGAHNPDLLRNPDIKWLSNVIDSNIGDNGQSAIKMVTLAPELDHGIEAIKTVVERDVVAALGHSDSSYEQAQIAIEAGVTVGTHLFNGMPPVHHREPGPIVALLRDPRITVELINDGIHIHSGVIGGVFEAVGKHRVALVTDCISAAGMPDGNYELAGSHIVVSNGIATLAQGNSLAGSTLTMDVSVRNAIAAGVPEEDVISAATGNPARALGLSDRGELSAGMRADLLVLDNEFTVRRVMQHGEWVVDRSAS